MPRPAGFLPGEPVDGDVVAYFGDDPRKLYQLRQWLPVLEQLDTHHRVLVVTRDPHSYAEACSTTSLSVVCAPTMPDLMALYEASAFRLALYVNNSMYNFVSLMSRTMLHVHINHGESDKVCMVSNQVKAYDRVFVAGQAAIDRHRAALVGFDHGKLVQVGRPQLDLRPAPVLPASDAPTILYAPTWEGENASNDYTSVVKYGPRIVAAALAVPGARVVYKPHPRVVTSTTPAVRTAHAEILRLLRGGHAALTEADILAVFPGCDLMITDVSSVGLDFLYVRGDKPMFVTDIRGDRERLRAEVPVSRCADIVDDASIGALTRILTDRLTNDVHRAARTALRGFYFGDLEPGESTARFIGAVTEVIELRDRLAGDAGLDPALFSGRPA
ncbi:MAG TPA: CDP-glycerol glycerophosphotransferase family protein [Jatrophihabitantaceae bacterium]|nr:CDP-glycerol glycerophosphotransferase family protein [Jatrophihabitantaceae bacterium]